MSLSERCRALLCNFDVSAGSPDGAKGRVCRNAIYKNYSQVQNSAPMLEMSHDARLNAAR